MTTMLGNRMALARMPVSGIYCYYLVEAQGVVLQNPTRREKDAQSGRKVLFEAITLNFVLTKRSEDFGWQLHLVA